MIVMAEELSFREAERHLLILGFCLFFQEIADQARNDDKRGTPDPNTQ